MTNLWIDDVRVPPAGYDWVKTSDEAIAFLSSHDKVSHISFDHDLGGEDNTRRVVLWLCVNTDKWPDTASVHSMNNVGREWLTGMIQRYGENCRLV